MALIKCPECGKEVSDQSEKCVNCGYPLNTCSNAKQQTNNNFQYTGNSNSPFFSNKEKADRMNIITWVVFIPLLILGSFWTTLVDDSKIIGILIYICAMIVALCLMPTRSYVEVFPNMINGRTRAGKKFTVKISEIINVARGGEQITICTRAFNYVVNCGNDGDKIIAYINQVKQAQ